MRLWHRKRKPPVTAMLDEHLLRKGFEQRAQLREKHRERLEELEHIDLPKDAVIVKRKDLKGFAAGFAFVILLVMVIGSAYAVYYAGNQQIVSTVTTGTAPITVTSTTKVANLNADLLDGYDSSSFTDPTCVPYNREGSVEGNAYSLVYSCTSCAGWIQGIRAGHSSGTTGGGVVKLEVDGTNTSTSFNTAGGNIQGWFVAGRYTNSLKIWMIESPTATGTYRATVSLCME